MRKTSSVLLTIAVVLAVVNIPVLVHRLFEPESSIFWDKETLLKTLLYWGSGFVCALGSGLLLSRWRGHQLAFVIAGATLMLAACEGASRSSEGVIVSKLACSMATIVVLLAFARRVFPDKSETSAP